MREHYDMAQTARLGYDLQCGQSHRVCIAKLGNLTQKKLPSADSWNLRTGLTADFAAVQKIRAEQSFLHVQTWQAL